jgi:hypothetical protein
MEEVRIELTVGLDLGLCLQGHTKWIGNFSTFVGVYKDGNTPIIGFGVRETPRKKFKIKKKGQAAMPKSN